MRNRGHVRGPVAGRLTVAGPVARAWLATWRAGPLWPTVLAVVLAALVILGCGLAYALGHGPACPTVAGPVRPHAVPACTLPRPAGP